MPENRGMRAPMVCRGLIRLASWMAPRGARFEWRTRWESGVRDWWILAQRGEVTGDTQAQIVRHCWGAFREAFWLRFSRKQLRHLVRGPAFLLVAAAAVLLVVAVLTRGFIATRGLVETARAPLPPAGSMGGREDALVAHTFAIVFALAIGIVLVAVGRLSLGRYGWRYWSFLVLKTITVMVIVPLLWIETGTAMRAHLPSAPLRVLVGGLLFTMVFMGAFGCALLWSFADQRRRCPVCLQRLAMPVTMGSWASVFEPVTTELLCEEGHGSLSVPETEAGEPDRWTPLDASWRELFDGKRK
jgi:hypothetical protein